MKSRTWSRIAALASTYEASVTSKWRRCRKRPRAARTSLMTHPPTIHRATAPRSFHAVGIKYTRANVSTCEVSCESTMASADARSSANSGVRIARVRSASGPRDSHDLRYARGLSIRRRLDAVKLGVLPAGGHERLVRSDLDDASAIQHDDQIRHPYRREAM